MSLWLISRFTEAAGRQYNRFSALCNTWGDKVIVPPVPADQMVDSEQSEA